MNQLANQIIDKIRKHRKLVAVEDFEIAAQEQSYTKKSYALGQSVGQSQDHSLWVQLRIWHRRRPGVGVIMGMGSQDVDTLVDSAVLSADLSTGDPYFRFPLWKSKPSSLDATSGNVDTDFPESSFERTDSFVTRERYENLSTMTWLSRKSESQSWNFGSSNRRYSCYWNFDQKGVGDLGFEQSNEWQDLNGLNQELTETLDWLRCTEGVDSDSVIPRHGDSILFSPSVMCGLLSRISPWFCADQVTSLQSPLANFKGKRIFGASEIDIFDDITLGEKRTLKALCDLEGVAPQVTPLVRGGVVESFLYDSQLAAKENRPSTANLNRRYGELAASIQPNGLCLRSKSSCSQSLLLGAMKNGVWVKRLRHLNVINDSLRLSGFGHRVVGGIASKNLSEILINIKVIDLLARIVAVGEDSEDWAEALSPSILFDRVPF